MAQEVVSPIISRKDAKLAETTKTLCVLCVFARDYLRFNPEES